MKGLLDCHGKLHIERAGVFKAARCIKKNTTCGDFCVAFLEPNANTIKTCCGTIVFDYFEDKKHLPLIMVNKKGQYIVN